MELTSQDKKQQYQENTHTAVRGVLEPPEPAPSILNMWPGLVWFLIIRMASRVQRIEPTKFVETIYRNKPTFQAKDEDEQPLYSNKIKKKLCSNIPV